MVKRQRGNKNKKLLKKHQLSLKASDVSFLQKNPNSKIKGKIFNKDKSDDPFVSVNQQSKNITDIFSSLFRDFNDNERTLINTQLKSKNINDKQKSNLLQDLYFTIKNNEKNTVKNKIFGLLGEFLVENKMDKLLVGPQEKMVITDRVKYKNIVLRSFFDFISPNKKYIVEVKNKQKDTFINNMYYFKNMTKLVKWTKRNIGNNTRIFGSEINKIQIEELENEFINFKKYDFILILKTPSKFYYHIFNKNLVIDYLNNNVDTNKRINENINGFNRLLRNDEFDKINIFNLKNLTWSIRKNQLKELTINGLMADINRRQKDTINEIEEIEIETEEKEDEELNFDAIQDPDDDIEEEITKEQVNRTKAEKRADKRKIAKINIQKDKDTKQDKKRIKQKKGRQIKEEKALNPKEVVDKMFELSVKGATLGKKIAITNDERNTNIRLMINLLTPEIKILDIVKAYTDKIDAEYKPKMKFALRVKNSLELGLVLKISNKIMRHITDEERIFWGKFFDGMLFTLRDIKVLFDAIKKQDKQLTELKNTLTKVNKENTEKENKKITERNKKINENIKKIKKDTRKKFINIIDFIPTIKFWISHRQSKGEVQFGDTLVKKKIN